MQQSRIDAEQGNNQRNFQQLQQNATAASSTTDVAIASTNINTDSTTVAASTAVANESATRRQRRPTCFKCNDAQAPAVICSRDGPYKGGYCVRCFRRNIGWSLREAFFRHCGMTVFLSGRDSAKWAEEERQRQQQQQQEEVATEPISIEPSTSAVVAVSGSYSSMSLLIQLAELNKELGERYALVTNKGKKPPPSGKSIAVRAMDLFVVHVTRFSDYGMVQTSADALILQRKQEEEALLLQQQHNDDDDNVDDDDGATRVAEIRRVWSILSTCETLGMRRDRVIFVSSCRSSSSSNNNDEACLYLPLLNDVGQRCFASSSSRVALSTREDIHRCLVRKLLVQTALHPRVRASVMLLGHNATSSSWSALADVSRGRGSSLFEGSGLFATGPGGLRILRPLVNISSRELALFCAIVCKAPLEVLHAEKAGKHQQQSSNNDNNNKKTILFDKMPWLIDCSVDNPTKSCCLSSSLDRALEDFVHNMCKSFASTAFNVTRSVDKVHQVNASRGHAVEEECQQQQQQQHHQKKQEEQQHAHHRLCSLCLFAAVDAERVRGHYSDASIPKPAGAAEAAAAAANGSLCCGCVKTLEELRALSVNQPAQAARQATAAFLNSLERYLAH